MTNSGKFDIAQELARAARSMAVHGNPDDTLDAIVVAARAAVPGFDEVCVTVVASDGAVTTMASTSDLVRELDFLQYELGEGPCLSAVRDQEPVLAQRLAEEQRWTRYVPRAAEAGIRAQMAVHLAAADGEVLGSLNFYSTIRDTIHHEAFYRASLFAAHASLALSYARRLEPPMPPPRPTASSGKPSACWPNAMSSPTSARSTIWSGWLQREASSCARSHARSSTKVTAGQSQTARRAEADS